LPGVWAWQQQVHKDAFEHLNLVIVLSTAPKVNSPSIRVMQKKVQSSQTAG